MLLSLDEWKSLLRHLECIASDLTDRDATLCFIKSRVCVVDISTERGDVRAATLPFEGFLEAIVHMAALKALPTDEQLRADGAADGGTWLLALKNDQPAEYEAFLKQGGCEWGTEQQLPADPPFPRRVSMIITYMLRYIEFATSGADDMKLSRKEVRGFLGAPGMGK